MRYLTYRSGNGLRLGSLQQDYIVDVGQVAGFESLLELIKSGPESWQKVATALGGVNLEELAGQGGAIKYRPELVATPLPDPPKNVICLGRNYFKHYLEGALARGESGDKPPDAPIYFTKPHTSIMGPFEPIPYDPQVSEKLDWEAEMGVIIGVGGRKISHEKALDHVFGYTVINDVSARDLQFKHQQWYKGKGLDYSCPIGPLVVTPDELPRPVHIGIGLKVNGVTKQEANTNQLMFDVPTIIAELSTTHRLEAGDIISTGTPDGVGHFTKPPEYLAVGDVMETIIEGIGTLRNRIVPLARFELVETYNQELASLLNVANGLKPSQYELSTACPGWSAKDLVAHMTNSAASVQMLMQRQLDHTPNPGAAALNERNTKGVESRRDRSVESMLSELITEHYKNIEFYLSLSDEELKTEGPLVSGEVVTVEERFRRAALHYREHTAMLREAIGTGEDKPKG